TANTEFETITGMSLRYFGPGEYPYKSILKETTCESAPFVLKKLGYSTHAIHNNEANFYGRRTVFPNLGFDTFTSEEYMEDEDEQNPLGWVRDRALVRPILDCLQSTEGSDYIYTISVQGHGDYPDEPILEDPKITVSGSATEEQNYKWEYYVNEIYEMDLFIQELIQALEDFGEPVVLVMYGDHLPTMGLEVEDMENRYLFQTQYVMWDNMGLKKKDENLASYQIAAELMNRLQIHEGNIFRYHQARRNTKNYQVDLEMLQYDILYGEQYVYKGRSPYLATKMRMGVYDATLDKVRPAPGLKESSYIMGTYFTPSSEVMINGEYIETNYLNPTTLLISDYVFQDMDKIQVVQRSNSSTRRALSSTRQRYYSVLKQGD
ncbi:MAG: LTA synthase family protein, partial [Lachnospiraceae bacterium]|nr:LTA synthase family protein [Lachnospiraceae bacterium]